LPITAVATDLGLMYVLTSSLFGEFGPFITTKESDDDDDYDQWRTEVGVMGVRTPPICV